MKLTFDQAIELLEITDISKVKAADIPRIRRKMQTRWHPDVVASQKDPALTQEYTTKFQQVELACELILSYLNGSYHAGEAFTGTSSRKQQETKDILRQEAPQMQELLKSLWNLIQERKYKWSIREDILSDGYKVRDLLDRDYKEETAVLSIVSFYYGLVFLAIMLVIANAINSALGTIVAIVCLLQSLSCILGFIPLSRFWLPEQVSNVMVWFINFGLVFYKWAERNWQHSKGWAILIIRLPVFFAKLVKYIILLPLTELAKALVGNKVMGLVKQKTNCYAEASDWYIEYLINSDSADLSEEELIHLSILHTELSDVKLKTNSESESHDSSENGSSRRSATQENKGSSIPPTESKANYSGASYNTQSFEKPKESEKHEPVDIKIEKNFTSELARQDDCIMEFVNTDFINITPKEFPSQDIPVQGKTIEPVKLSAPTKLPEDNYPSSHNIQQTEPVKLENKRKKTVIWSLIILLLAFAGLAGFFLLGNKKEELVRNTTVITTEVFQDTAGKNNKEIVTVGDTNTVMTTAHPDSPLTIAVKKEDMQVIEPKNAVLKDETVPIVSQSTKPVNILPHSSFMYLDKNKVRNDLLNKSLCEGLKYIGDGQKLAFINAFPAKEYQSSIDLYGTIRIIIVITDETENKSCKVEVIYKKDRNKYELETYAEK